MNFLIYLFARLGRYLLTILGIVIISGIGGGLIGLGTRHPLIAIAILLAIVVVWFVADTWHKYEEER